MLPNETLSLVDQFIKLKDSTTRFLELIKGLPLKLKIDSQTSENARLQRSVRLYFRSATNPLLYCVSDLDEAILTEGELDMLVNQVHPIGHIFLKHNNPKLIHKEDIRVSTVENRELAKALNVDTDVMYKKQYDYFVGKRKIGTIKEYFTESSLTRL